MTNDLTIALGVLVGIMTIAMLVQLGLWLAMFLAGRRIQGRAEQSAKHVRALVKVSRRVVEENRAPVRALAHQVTQIAGAVRHEVGVLGAFSADVRRGIHTEQEHAGVVIEDARRRAHQTMELVSRGVSAPFRGVARGIRKAVHFFESRAA